MKYYIAMEQTNMLGYVDMKGSLTNVKWKTKIEQA